MEKLRVGLIGLGGVCGAVHYPGFSRIPGVEIAGICDADAGLVARRQQEWGLAQGCTEVDEFLRQVQPEAVAIATPNVYHQRLIYQALEAGCHVICEKPLGMNYPQTIEIYQRALASGRRHMTAFTYRFVPGMNYLRHLVRSGELGQVRHARFQRLQDWGELAIGWRQYKDQAGSGELGDMGIHRIDFAEDLLGPIEVVCAAARQWASRDRRPDGQPCSPQDVEDWVAWICEFAGGTTGIFEMGKLTKGRGPDGGHDLAELNGTEASATYQLHTPHQILYARRGEPYQVRPVPAEFLKRPGSPRNPGEGDPVQTFRYDQAWEFVSAIRQGRECLPSFYHGMRAQAVADAILEAAASRRWVEVPPCQP
ncbi:MAG: Gfo/Idh/MocA family oxidoreductase [Candidatus Handelsmanbacteria bacterium]|nr:Gfo/Idh/MocA family oxidoreductase [Candidatus Handelsmanbacteria bacterium]